jgi:hypothetical protein
MSKVVKRLSKSCQNCQTVVKKLSKNLQKVCIKFAKICKKFVKIRSKHLLKILKRSEEEAEGEGDL